MKYLQIAMIIICASIGYAVETMEIKLSDSAVLKIEYNDYGTRSEGQTGTLVVDGKVIEGKEGDTIEINKTKLKYYPEKQDSLWLPKKWNYEDRSLITYSFHKE